MAYQPHIRRYASQGVTLLGDPGRPEGVTLAFTERTGGCSQAPYGTLNLGVGYGDDDAAVAKNRRRLLAALGIEGLGERLVNPLQVHGSEVLVVASGEEAAVGQAREAARQGVDAVVCQAANVPVLLLGADCPLVVMVAPGAFAVVHSGWRGTIERICAKALAKLVELCGCDPSQVLCYVGPHISGADYQVSPELAQRFARAFGPEVTPDATHLDLGAAIRATLLLEGVGEQAIWDQSPSTATCISRFFSYRASDGRCGRHGALACMLDEDVGR